MCASCHGEDGSARTASGQKLSGRDFTNRKWQANRTDAQIAKVILDGKDAMPPFRGTLSEADALALTRQVLRPMGASR
jgi:mono/diheme cytochrome c family protein